MPGGRFTKKEDRQAAHVAASERKRGVSAKKAKSIGYATVNKRKKTSRKKTSRKKATAQKFSAAATARNREGKPDKAPMRRKRNKGRT